jgi:hypothetical protein
VGKVVIKADKKIVSKKNFLITALLLVSVIAMLIFDTTNPDLSLAGTLGRFAWAIIVLSGLIPSGGRAVLDIEVNTDKKTIRRTFYAIKFPATHYEKILPWSESLLGHETYISIVTPKMKQKLFCVIGKESLSDDLNSRLGVLPEDFGYPMPTLFSLPKRSN